VHQVLVSLVWISAFALPNLLFMTYCLYRAWCAALDHNR
jgi:hypothetical protein